MFVLFSSEMSIFDIIMDVCYEIFFTFPGHAAIIVLIFILIILNYLQTNLKNDLMTWLKQLASVCNSSDLAMVISASMSLDEAAQKSGL